MLTKKIFAYAILLMAIFFSLFFITGQNKDYRDIDNLEKKLYKQIENELISYKENLYAIERTKSGLDKGSKKQSLDVGTIILDKEDDIKKIQEQIEKL